MIGLAVDDTEPSGAALLTTSVVLALTGIVYFGILVSFGTIVAFLADLTLSPALVALVYRGTVSRPGHGRIHPR